MEEEHRTSEEHLFIVPIYYRALNYIIDSIIISMVVQLFLPQSTPQTFSDWFKQENYTFTFASLGASFVYYFVLETVFGKTIGKFITRTKVVDEYGHKPQPLSIAKRTLCRFIPFEFVSFFFNPLGWHDRWSDTMVVYQNPPKPKAVEDNI